MNTHNSPARRPFAPPDVEHDRRLYWEADELESTSDGQQVMRRSSHRAPAKSGRRASFWPPVACALSGAVWALLIWTLVGWHYWLIAPVAFAAAYGFLVVGERR